MNIDLKAEKYETIDPAAIDLLEKMLRTDPS